MKKKILIPIIAVIALLIILFIPIPSETYKDGGTKEYKALTYKIVKWSRIYGDNVYQETKVYFLPQSLKSVDELWQIEKEAYEKEYGISFTATVLEIGGSSVTVEPCEGEKELQSSDQITFGTENLDKIDVRVGDIVKVTYKGGIMESYPAQINAVKWEITKNFRNRDYTQNWIDKETAEKQDGTNSSDFVITEIYSDCFFASYAFPMPDTVKFNGKLSEEWCVGDQVKVEYKNAYRDTESHKMEAEVVSVKESTLVLEPGVNYKPVIYLYPQQKTDISVKLNLNGKLTCTYPAYNNGWFVTASPDGTLLDTHRKTYNYLYWEGETDTRWDMSKGFCVKGKDTAEFLEYALDRLGLTRREANEFIVFWLPLMENNPYNIISFQTDIYTENIKLQVTPSPDTQIRVFMTYKPSNTYIDIEEQTLSCPERKGFTLVEWGGAVVK